MSYLFSKDQWSWNIAVLFVSLGWCIPDSGAELISYPTTANPVMDGVVSPLEWNSAGFEADGGGLLGYVYAEWRNGLNYNSWSYSGVFSFLLHNIEQNTTFANGVGGTDPAYNVFDIYSSADSVNKLLEVTVRYDGFTVDRYNAFGNIVGTRTFTYGVDLAPEQTASYDWDNYWGVYARGGFGNSAYTSGLFGAIDNNNQLFEVAYRGYSGDSGDSGIVRRSVKDPDQLNNWQLVTYLDTTVRTVPEIDPATGGSVFSLVAGVLAMIEQRRRRGAASTAIAA